MDKLRKLGETATKKREVGCLILAGGLGLRLGYKSPKGFFPISVIRKKSLFQLLFERIAVLEKRLNCQLKIALLLSLVDHQKIVSFLKKHQFFGLQESQCTFLIQKSYPYLDLEGNSLTQVAPNGNGGAFEAMCEARLIEDWIEQGISYLQVIPIDNPLADPFDFALTGLMSQKKADVVLQAIYRKRASEKIGVIVKEKGVVRICDYMEISRSASTRIDKKGNSGHFCFSLAFLLKQIKQQAELPIHWVQKKIKIAGREKVVWKGEKFLFDLVPLARHVEILVAPRENVFAPLKERKGENGVAAVRKALFKRDQRIFEEITGRKAPNHLFELAPEFLYPTKQLQDRWKRSHFVFRSKYIKDEQPT